MSIGENGWKWKGWISWRKSKKREGQHHIGITEENLTLRDELRMFEASGNYDSCGKTFVSCGELDNHQKKFHEDKSLSEKNLLYEKMILI